MSKIKHKIKTRHKAMRTHAQKKLNPGSRHNSKLLALAVISLIACVGAYITFDASAASKDRGTIFFEGDSITALYSADPKAKGNKLYTNPKVPGYHAYLTDAISKKLNTNLKAVNNAQGGSGFIKRGTLEPHQNDEVKCGGSTFEERLNQETRIQIRKAAAVVIEGGRNDSNKCNSKNQKMDAPTPEVKQAVDSYFDKILALRDGNPRDVFVITPWGMQQNAKGRERIQAIVKESAMAHGFTYINTNGTLDPNRQYETTYDGVHPNKEGGKRIANRILENSNIKQVVARNLKR